MASFSSIFAKKPAYQSALEGGSSAVSSRSRNRLSFFSTMSAGQRKIVRRALLMGAFVVLLIIIVAFINAKASNRSAVAGVSTTSNAATIQVNQSYTFNARDNQDKIVQNMPLKMTITSAQIQNQILIQGQPATAQGGKTFLIFNIDIQNTYTTPYYLPVNEFVRWEDSGKLRAPDVHNGLVLIDPISTKTTRVGFLVNGNQKDFTFQIGEVAGTKQTMDLKI